MRPDWGYFDLENIADRTLILEDIPLFFRNNQTQVILDEVQLFPEIFAFLRGHIDANRAEANRFILTGSSSPDLLKAHAETLAGRAAMAEISPLSMSEISQVPRSPFFLLFENPITEASKDSLQTLAPQISHEVFQQTWLRGGFPELQTKPHDFQPHWQENYVNSYIERNVRRYFPGLNFDNFRKFLLSLRDYHGQQLNVAEFSRALGIGESSVRRYLEIADGMYFWRELPSLQRSVLRSLTKQPKGFFRDSGLYHYLARIHTVEELWRSRHKGASFEAFVIEELARGIASTMAINVEYSFVRTRGGLEVDLIIDGSFGKLPVEIKCSSSTSLKEVAGLKKFIDQEDLPLGLVVNCSERVGFLSEKILQIPVTCL